MENQDEKDARHRVQVEQHHRHLDGKYPKLKVANFPAVSLKRCQHKQIKIQSLIRWVVQSTKRKVSLLFMDSNRRKVTRMQIFHSYYTPSIF